MAELGPAHPSGASPSETQDDWCANLSCYMALTDAEKTAIGSVCFLAGPATFLENALVLGAIAASRRLRRRPSYLFIGSLALADVFASCFFTISFLDFHLLRRRDGRDAYLFKLGGVTLAFTSSLGSLLLTAIDRYVCIHHAPRYKAVLTRRRALGGLAALWSVSVLVSFLPLMGWTCPTGLTPPCSRLLPYIHNQYLACWTGFILTLLGLILVAYGLVLWRAHQHEASMARLGGGAGGHARMRMDIRLARTLGLILLILAVCWLPVLSFMLADVSHRLTRTHQRVFTFCSMLCLVNSAVNPLLYALRCQELRQALQRALGRWRGRCGRCRGRGGEGREAPGAPSLSNTEANTGSSPGSEDEPLGGSLSEAVDKQQLAVFRK
ncbi:cannabinoid receptor 2 [Conger conger]|uniref:cannabinoid receptor 2 n=1 Tax=Conger conger TaxID=82655 RepID=UPI002A5AC6B0|nr:cannabinoid receptor 2 [Conger conger]